MNNDSKSAERVSGKLILGAIGASCCVPLAVAGGTIGGALGIAGILLILSKKIFSKNS